MPALRKTHDLIASDKVEGTRVYGQDGKHIGTIERVILEKRSGRVSYAVLGFGGFLGIGEDHYPLPWQKLSYDESLGGYRHRYQPANRSKARRNIMAMTSMTGNKENGRRVYDYYGRAPVLDVMFSDKYVRKPCSPSRAFCVNSRKLLRRPQQGKVAAASERIRQ